jgi:hypothetical protein
VGALLGLAFGVALVSDVVWRLVLALFWQDGGPGVAAALVVLAVLLVVVAALVYTGHRWLARRIGGLQMETAGIVTWWLIALLVFLLLPGAAYLFVWPALAAALATWLTTRQGCAAPGWWGRLGALALVAVPTVVLSVPLLDTLYQLGQPRPGNIDSQLLDMVALVGLIAALAAGLLIPHLRRASTTTP